MTDWVLRGGKVIDGSGTPRYRADIAVSRGRIAHILEPGEAASGDVVDASGFVISPGFIDMHAHSDLAVLSDPTHIAKVSQGVTLEVVGQDGLGYSPVNGDVMAVIRDQITAWNGHPDLDYSWRTIAEYLDRVDQNAPVNVAVLVPHGAVRMTVMGESSRAATADELRSIREIVAQGLRDGAVGMSTGLTYTPGMYASDDEIVDALAAVREFGGYYCPHHRNYGSRVIESYIDCIDIARRAGVALHLTHCHVNFPRNKGRASEVLAAIDSAVAEGLDITTDSYPYLAGASYLAALLPSWTRSEGSEVTIGLLKEPSSRRRILHEVEVDGSDGHHGIPADWDTVIISSVKEPSNNWALGRSIAELARGRSTTGGSVFADLLVADSLGTGSLSMVGNEENVRTVMCHTAHTVGTDGILVGSHPHPRGWGTFPRFLGTYVRDLELMSLEEGIVHVTSRPARRLGLVDRGLISEGFWADLVVFDPDTIASPATYEDPKLKPIGIPHVFVNGEIALQNGRRTTALPGRAIRRPTKK